MLNECLTVFKSLNAHKVKYLVIGGIAVLAHGIPRVTFDLDLSIEATEENARRLLDALHDVGLGTATLITPEQLLAKEITIFKDILRVDVQTKTPGISFDSAWPRRKTMHYQGEPFYVLSRSDLIRAKEAAGRAVDIEDVRVLKSLESDERDSEGS